jgi:hypothetical protein
MTIPSPLTLAASYLSPPDSNPPNLSFPLISPLPSFPYDPFARNSDVFKQICPTPTIVHRDDIKSVPTRHTCYDPTTLPWSVWDTSSRMHGGPLTLVAFSPILCFRVRVYLALLRLGGRLYAELKRPLDIYLSFFKSPIVALPVYCSSSLRYAAKTHIHSPISLNPSDRTLSDPLALHIPRGDSIDYRIRLASWFICFFWPQVIQWAAGRVFPAGLEVVHRHYSTFDSYLGAIL